MARSLERTSRRTAALALVAELVLVLLGFYLRWTFTRHANASYDLVDHQRYIDWFRDHWALPSIGLSRLTYGPPLYHAISGVFRRMGTDWTGLIRISAIVGAARLCLLWWGLRVVLPTTLPGAWLGRLAALALAAVLPAAVHIDGMVNNESLSMLACWAVMLCWLKARSPDARVVRRATIAAGVLLAIALLTKFSGVMLVIAAIGAAILELLWHRPRRALPWLASAALAVVLVAPYYARNYANVGLLFPTAFEAGDAGAMRPETLAKPLWERRPTDFFWRVTTEIYRKPYYSVGSGQFISTLLAVTYSDYSAYYFSPRGPKGPPEGWTPEITALAGASVAGGTIVAIATVLALLALAGRAVGRRDATTLALLATSVLAVLGQLYFATKYPLDHYGVIKGTYLQFAAAPLYVCFGAAVAWSARRRWLAGLLVATLLVGLGCVAAYTVTCRLTIERVS